MFIMIIATWVQYTRPIIIARLLPSTIDAAIPFFFGVTQALIIFSITLQQVAWFYFAFSLNALVGFASFVSTVRELKQHEDRIENKFILARARPSIRMNTRMIVLRSVIFFSFGMIETLFKLQSLFLAVVVLAMNIVMIIAVHRSTEQALGR